MLPPKTTQLASIAAFLTGRLLAALKDSERPFDVTAALLWNNLSERLQDAGFFPSALECARESVARLRRLTSQDSTHRAQLVVSLLTLSKRLTANQRHGEAIQVAEEAVRESGLLLTGNAQARNHHRAPRNLACPAR